jgi:hypothetical protein
MEVASIGPLDPTVRDRVAAFRDERGLPNYNEAVRTLLEEVAD